MKRLFVLISLCCAFQTAAQEYIQDWLVLGPFHHSDRNLLLSTDYLEGEEQIKPAPAAACAGRFWLHRRHSGSILDLNRTDLPFEFRAEAAAYAAAWIHSSKQQPALLLCASDDGLKAWLNGSVLFQHDRFHRLIADSDSSQVMLQPGWNLLLLKVSNGSGGWQVCARFQGAEGLTIDHRAGQPAVSTESTPFIPYSLRISDGFVLDSLDTPWIATRLCLLARRDSKTAELKSPGYPEGPGSAQIISPLSADSLHYLDLLLPLAAIRSAASCSLTIQEGDRSFLLVAALPSAFDLMYSWFQPWRFEGWRSAGTRAFERTVHLPDVLRGCRVAVMANIGDSWGQVTADGRSLITRFSRDSGDLLFHPQTTESRTHFLQVEIDSGKPQLLQTRLQVHHAEIEDYLYSKQFSRSLPDLPQADLQATDAQLLALLCSGRAEQAADMLAAVMPRIQESVGRFKKYSVSLLGNAHIDLMWLWRYPETLEVINNTFTSVLNLMDQHPEFRFTHGQAQSYVWLEKLQPRLFAKVKERIQQGRWEIIGGSWSQPDNNMPSGESLVRQYLYGKRYFREKFGVDVSVGFMPDTFGHPASLPQILKKCGITDYIFFRPLPQEQLFYWRSPDGSTVLAYRPPDWYNSGVTADIGRLPMITESKFGVANTLRCYGVGDHGGGPTERDVQLAKQLNRTIGYPQVQFVNAHDYFAQIRPHTTTLDTIEDELNFVFEGCWTSQAMVKKYNRRLEALLPGAETFAVLAGRYGVPYPCAELEEAWHGVLLNQFHDILDGSGIAAIYPDVRAIYERADSLGQAVLSRSLTALARQVAIAAPQSGAKPILLFNHLNWPRQEPVTIRLQEPATKNVRFLDQQGQVLPSQREESGLYTLLPPEVPAFGYTVLFYQPATAKPVKIAQRNLILQNRFLRVEVNHKTGHVVSIYDRRLARELLRSPANLLQLQSDDNQSMTAWTIRLLGQVTTLNKPGATRIVESNELRKVMRVVYQSGPSRFEQDIILYADLARVDFCLRVNWQHRDTMLKVAFPLNVNGQACFELPFGVKEREQTGREMVSQKWVDLSEAGFGIALLNDCKYGFDVQNNVLRLSALRSPHDPDSTADQGRHEMHYALYPHSGDWRTGEVPAAAASYNTPLWSVAGSIQNGALAMSHSFLQVQGDGVLVSACKKAEADSATILRLVESFGRPAEVRLDLHGWETLQEVNMMEEKIRDLPADSSTAVLRLLPWEVRTLAVYGAGGKKPAW